MRNSSLRNNLSFAPPARDRFSGEVRVNTTLVQRFLATGAGIGIAATPEQLPAKFRSSPGVELSDNTFFAEDPW